GHSGPDTFSILLQETPADGPSGLVAAPQMPSFDADDRRARGTAAAVSLAAWNGSGNESVGNPAVLGAVAARSWGLGAGSGPQAWEHASCKRMLVVLDNSGSAE